MCLLYPIMLKMTKPPRTDVEQFTIVITTLQMGDQALNMIIKITTMHLPSPSPYMHTLPRRSCLSVILTIYELSYHLYYLWVKLPVPSLRVSGLLLEVSWRLLLFSINTDKARVTVRLGYFKYIRISEKSNSCQVQRWNSTFFTFAVL